MERLTVGQKFLSDKTGNTMEITAISGSGRMMVKSSDGSEWSSQHDKFLEFVNAGKYNEIKPVAQKFRTLDDGACASILKGSIVTIKSRGDKGMVEVTNGYGEDIFHISELEEVAPEDIDPLEDTAQNLEAVTEIMTKTEEPKRADYEILFSQVQLDRVRYSLTMMIDQQIKRAESYKIFTRNNVRYPGDFPTERQAILNIIRKLKKLKDSHDIKRMGAVGEFSDTLDEFEEVVVNPAIDRMSEAEHEAALKALTE